MLEVAGLGFAAGLVSTGLMTLVQYPFWLMWSTAGILEWHENVCIAAKVFRRRAEEMLLQSFLSHFLNGGLAAMFYAIIVYQVVFLKSLDVWVLGVLFGLFLWLTTLAPIHRPITGVSIIRHPLGKGPVALSIFVHLIYGLSTAYIVSVYV